jgi:hypothetical protein
MYTWTRNMLYPKTCIYFPHPSTSLMALNQLNLQSEPSLVINVHLPKQDGEEHHTCIGWFSLPWSEYIKWNLTVWASYSSCARSFYSSISHETRFDEQITINWSLINRIFISVLSSIKLCICVSFCYPNESSWTPNRNWT